MGRYLPNPEEQADALQRRDEQKVGKYRYADPELAEPSVQDAEVVEIPTQVLRPIEEAPQVESARRSSPLSKFMAVVGLPFGGFFLLCGLLMLTLSPPTINEVEQPWLGIVLVLPGLALLYLSYRTLRSS